MDDTQILTINSGSSSIKFSIYEVLPLERLIISGNIERIGERQGRFIIKQDQALLFEQSLQLDSHEMAFQQLFTWLQEAGYHQTIGAIGHRVLTGGKQCFYPQLITPELLQKLDELKTFDVEHLPHEIRGIQLAGQYLPHLKQVACFDTAFHRHMPIEAQLFGIPRHYYDEGIMRYGFHGLSYEYIISALDALETKVQNKQKIIIAHLGNGASMAAIKNRRSIDTSMGFTPTGGLVMSTRAGDLDPGVMYYLLQKKLSAKQVYELLNQQSGLLGVSTTTASMQDLLNMQPQQQYALEAIALFCYQAKKAIGAFTAALNGLNTLIFSGGIGENAAAIRWQICQDMDFFGIRLDADLNAQHAAIISAEKSRVVVRVMHTNEEVMIARHTAKTLRK
jgi:acetate kinase